MDSKPSVKVRRIEECSVDGTPYGDIEVWWEVEGINLKFPKEGQAYNAALEELKKRRENGTG